MTHKQDNFWETKSFGRKGTVLNCREYLGIHFLSFLFLTKWLHFPHGVRKCDFSLQMITEVSSLTPRCYTHLDPLQTCFHKDLCLILLPNTFHYLTYIALMNRCLLTCLALSSSKLLPSKTIIQLYTKGFIIPQHSCPVVCHVSCLPMFPLCEIALPG